MRLWDLVMGQGWWDTCRQDAGGGPCYDNPTLSLDLHSFMMPSGAEWRTRTLHSGSHKVSQIF